MKQAYQRPHSGSRNRVDIAGATRLRQFLLGRLVPECLRPRLVYEAGLHPEPDLEVRRNRASGNQILAGTTALRHTPWRGFNGILPIVSDAHSDRFAKTTD
jgi:hypothetical protein